MIWPSINLLSVRGPLTGHEGSGGAVSGPIGPGSEVDADDDADDDDDGGGWTGRSGSGPK